MRKYKYFIILSKINLDIDFMKFKKIEKIIKIEKKIEIIKI